jgi:hypothetical protein
MRNTPQIPHEFSHYSNHRSIKEMHEKEDKRMALGILIAGLVFVATILLFY